MYSSIHEDFKVPIFYNEQKRSINNNIIKELEIIENYDASMSDCSISESVYGNKTVFKRPVHDQLVDLYTTDTSFLKEQQDMLKLFKKENFESIFEEPILNCWEKLKNDSGFKEKYFYVEWQPIEFLNYNDHFLQLVSVFNLTSPILSFCIPFIMLLIPFCIINLKGLKVSTQQYFEILKSIASTHALGKLFHNFNDVRLQEKIYLLLSAAFYVFSIYQNVLLCIKFNSNISTIHQYFDVIKDYISKTLNRMNAYLDITNKLSSHTVFNEILRKKMDIFISLQSKVDKISPFQMSLSKFSQVGYVLKTFYELHDSKIHENVFSYSFGFNGYIDSMVHLSDNINDKHINFCSFTRKRKSSKLVDSYYLALKDKSPVKNNISIKNNLVITGPNASGKTTTLKATFLNIIFSQQFGCGFYSNAIIKPFHHFHCYLNIPDTSGRDSLFQAEARRCKDVIDIINSNNKETHLCIFDELYSGTNPDEAVSSAFGLMKYLTDKKKVNCLLTTHYYSLCSKLSTLANIKNYKMDSKVSDTKELHYNFKLIKGISTIKGGIHVLSKMNYPEEIMSEACQSVLTPDDALS